MKECHIVEDLWPLYEEDLVQPETRTWIEAHCATCPQCQQLREGMPIVEVPLPKAQPEDTIARVTRKLQLYQFIFVAFAFFFAMNTTLFSEQAFQFMLSYFVLGAVVYVFYTSWLFTVLLAFIPTALATTYTAIRSYDSFSLWWAQTVDNSSSMSIAVLQHVAAASIVGALHTIFALLGALCVWLIQKGTQKE